MEKKKLEIFKAPIMSIVVVSGLVPGIPTYNNRFIFYIGVILPFLPIFKYASSNDDSDISLIAAFCYFLFYIVFTIIVVQKIKKIGSQWNKKEYDSLKPDMITFPFILVMLVNSGLHFLVFYLISLSFF